jgi:hypothetical protein
VPAPDAQGEPAPADANGQGACFILSYVIIFADSARIQLPNRVPPMFLTMILQLRLVLGPKQTSISKTIPPTAAANSFRRRLFHRVSISRPPQCIVGIADRRGLALMHLRPVLQFDKPVADQARRQMCTFFEGEEAKECLICRCVSAHIISFPLAHHCQANARRGPPQSQKNFQ